MRLLKTDVPRLALIAFFSSLFLSPGHIQYIKMLIERPNICSSTCEYLRCYPLGSTLMSIELPIENVSKFGRYHQMASRLVIWSQNEQEFLVCKNDIYSWPPLPWLNDTRGLYHAAGFVLSQENSGLTPGFQFYGSGSLFTRVHCHGNLHFTPSCSSQQTRIKTLPSDQSSRPIILWKIALAFIEDLMELGAWIVIDVLLCRVPPPVFLFYFFFLLAARKVKAYAFIVILYTDTIYYNGDWFPH